MTLLKLILLQPHPPGSVWTWWVWPSCWPRRCGSCAGRPPWTSGRACRLSERWRRVWRTPESPLACWAARSSQTCSPPAQRGGGGGGTQKTGRKTEDYCTVETKASLGFPKITHKMRADYKHSSIFKKRADYFQFQRSKRVVTLELTSESIFFNMNSK